MYTLVLDQGYQPHRVVPWQRAFSMLWTGKAELVEEYDEEIHTVTLSFKVPAVVRLLRKITHRNGAVKFSRINVMTRDNFTCQYCGTKFPMKELNYDHVIPRSQGGKTTWENIVVACYPCNSRKRNRTPEQAGMKLLRQPVKPKFLPVVNVRLNLTSIPDLWTSYIYWNTELEHD